jgi:hypothetical protein
MTLNYRQLMKRKETIERAVDEKLVDALAEYFPIQEDVLIEALQEYFPPEPVEVIETAPEPVVEAILEEEVVEEESIPLPPISVTHPPKILTRPAPVIEEEVEDTPEAIIEEPKYIDDNPVSVDEFAQIIQESNERICSALVEGLEAIKPDKIKGWVLDIVRDEDGLICKINVNPKE